MATADHIKALIQAHIDQDDERFKTVVLNTAAYEARHGHETFAKALKQYAEKIGTSKADFLRNSQQNSMFYTTSPSDRLSDLVVPPDILECIHRILNEFRNRRKLQTYGLCNRRKILMEGRPGTGKAFTASVIASELHLPLRFIQMDKVVSRYLGETSVKLRQAFDELESQTGVYFFEVFDAFGVDKSLDNDFGEAWRILNSFLQYIEQDTSDSIIIAATNNQRLLDKALFQCFDDILHYSMPTLNEVQRLFELKLGIYDSELDISQDLIEKALPLSHAEIAAACDDAIKTSILRSSKISACELGKYIDERIEAYAVREA